MILTWCSHYAVEDNHEKISDSVEHCSDSDWGPKTLPKIWHILASWHKPMCKLSVNLSCQASSVSASVKRGQSPSLRLNLGRWTWLTNPHFRQHLVSNSMKSFPEHRFIIVLPRPPEQIRLISGMKNSDLTAIHRRFWLFCDHLLVNLRDIPCTSKETSLG